MSPNSGSGGTHLDVLRPEGTERPEAVIPSQQGYGASRHTETGAHWGAHQEASSRPRARSESSPVSFTRTVTKDGVVPDPTSKGRIRHA